MFTTLLAIAWAQDCEQTYTDQDLRGIAVLAEGAFASVDADGFHSARRELDVALSCMNEPIQPTTVGKVFLVTGLGAHLDGEVAQVEAAMAAFAEVEQLAPPTSVAPPGHPIRTAWEKAKLRPSARHPLPVPDGGRIWIDGTETLEQPEERPYLVQMITDGKVTWTQLVSAGSQPPEYAIAPEETRKAYTDHIVKTDRKHPLALVAVTSVLFAGAAGTFLASHATRAKYLNQEKTPAEELPGLRRTTNALVLSSIGLTVGATGLGVATVVAW